MRLRTLPSIICVLALGLSAGAQNINANESRREVTSSAKPAEPKISDEDRAKAIQLLDQSDAQSRSFEAPLRSYMLYQIAQSYLPLDKTKSRALYKDAFTATLEIRDDDADSKQLLQDSILTGMLTVSQPDVEERLAQAEPEARERATAAIIQRYTTAKQYDRAVDLIESMTSWTEFPYGVAMQVMAALPEQMNGDFRTLFTQAVSSYQSHEHKGINVGGSLPAIILKFGTRLPPRTVLDAIDDILKQAKKQDAASITMSGEGGTASFTSAYEYQLFQLLPILRKYDEGTAKKLLEEDNAVKSMSQQYPNGVQSLDPGSADNDKPDDDKNKPRNSGLSVNVSSGDSARHGPSPEQQMSMEADRRARQIATDSTKDPMQAIAEAAGLPSIIGGQSPRSEALRIIAQSNIKTNPKAAKQAFDEMRKSIVDLRPQRQVQYLVAAAKGYLQMEETESAEKTLGDGFKISDKLLVEDKDADDPNKALKAYWPSVETYRQLLEVETKISQKDALAMLNDIQDEEMQTIERVMFANALLGKPMKQSIMRVKKKNQNSMSISSSN